ncbi:Flocculation suppression protein [Entomophthora muscae]|uniref:Flocculation suppression protein n=1 Tax=Entomophthora muscae TaxID=34485 RepID=A0ACC2TGG1_9FUNG|nr:Flocculation suppression protein [Entomophthora muscae]
MAELQAKTVPTFVEKLQTILEDSELHNLVSWNKDGQSFGVHDCSEFSQTVLPKHFKHSNWQSFVRQLNMYGFSKISDAFHLSISASWEFRHPAFKRGRPDLYSSIKRRAPKVSTKATPAVSTSSHSPQPSSECPSTIEHLSAKLEALEHRVEWQANIIGNLQDQLTASHKAHQHDHAKLEIAIRALTDLHEDEAAFKRLRRTRLDSIDIALGQRSSSPPSNPKNTPQNISPQPFLYRLPPISSLDSFNPSKLL